MENLNSKRVHIAELGRRIRSALRTLARGWTIVRQSGHPDVESIIPEEQLRLVTQLLEEIEASQSSRYVTNTFWFVVMFGLLSLFLSLITAHMASAICGILIISAAIWLRAREVRRLSKTRNRLMGLSETIDGAAVMPRLLEFAQRRPGFQRGYRERLQAIGPYLHRLFPTVTPEMSDNWSPVQREALCDIIRSPLIDFNLTIHALRVIAFSGNRLALVQVRLLAANVDWSITLSVPRVMRANRRNAIWVREAARKCLPVLEERVERLESAATLLRMSHASANAAASLLRPVAPSVGDAADSLLRSNPSAFSAITRETSPFGKGYDVTASESGATMHRAVTIGGALDLNETS